MKKVLRSWKVFLLPCLALIATFGIIHHNGVGKVSADKRESATNTPQTLPFSQNWTNVGLITVNDDYSTLPGILGYHGNDLTAVTGTDPRTILADGSATTLDVIANQTNPDTLASGGVAEFDGIANPSIALNGSGTADAPHIVIHLNTTGQSTIQFACNVRDLDASADDAAQQVDVQYRVGGTGSYASVPGGYIADATTTATATQVTPLNLTLPAAANNQSLVEVRVISTNAIGNDEWVGIDDISVTAGPPVVAADAPMDVNGDGKTDYVVYRQVVQQLRWFYNINGTGAPTVSLDWGLNGDLLEMEDFDGDGKDDVTAYRQAAGLNSAFYILQSQTNTLRIDQFGLIGDDASVVGDYDGDGKADTAVYRSGATAGAQSTWFYRGSLTPGVINYVPWGINGDKVAPGDYDGNGRNDFVIARNDAGSLRFWQRLSTGTITTQVFGLTGDLIVPGDYDGDGKTDLAITRNPGIGSLNWFILPSSGGNYQHFLFGNFNEVTAQGDYDGDGKVDVAIWRFGTGEFWSRNSGNGAAQVFQLGSSTDQAVGIFNRH